MRKITFRARFMRDEQYVYDAVMFAGTVGVYTGFKAGAFSISENQRHSEYDYDSMPAKLLKWVVRDTGKLEKFEDGVKVAENIAMIFTGYNEVSWLIRSTLEHCNDFKCAHSKLTRTKIDALGYIILAGTQ